MERRECGEHREKCFCNDCNNFSFVIQYSQIKKDVSAFYEQIDKNGDILRHFGGGVVCNECSLFQNFIKLYVANADGRFVIHRCGIGYERYCPLS